MNANFDQLRHITKPNMHNSCCDNHSDVVTTRHILAACNVRRQSFQTQNVTNTQARKCKPTDSEGCQPWDMGLTCQDVG